MWVWVVGLRFLWRSGRALVWAYGLLFAFFAVTAGAKTFYLAGAYVYLLAAGPRSPERLGLQIVALGAPHHPSADHR